MLCLFEPEDNRSKGDFLELLSINANAIRAYMQGQQDTLDIVVTTVIILWLKPL